MTLHAVVPAPLRSAIVRAGRAGARVVCIGLVTAGSLACANRACEAITRRPLDLRVTATAVMSAILCSAGSLWHAQRAAVLGAPPAPRRGGT